MKEGEYNVHGSSDYCHLAEAEKAQREAVGNNIRRVNWYQMVEYLERQEVKFGIYFVGDGRCSVF